MNAVHRIVGVENIVEIEFCGKFQLRFGFRKFSNAECIIIFNRIITMIRLHEIRGDVTQRLLRLLIFLQRLIPLRGIGNGVEIAA